MRTIWISALISLVFSVGIQTQERKENPSPPDYDLAVMVYDTTSTSIAIRCSGDALLLKTTIYLLAEPYAGNLDKALKIAEITGERYEHTIAGLAPDVHYFIFVEQSRNGFTHSAQVHGHTLGGPRAKLDSAVRNVHLYAPDILMIVLSNGDGTAWQSPWTVKRRDGSLIGIAGVSRHSLVVGAPGYEVGFGKPTNDSILDVEHRIFLKLAQPPGSPEILTVTGPFNTQFTLAVSDYYLETPVIQVNQVGYNPRATRRYAYVSGWMGSGGPLSLAGFPLRVQVLQEGPGETRIPVDELPLITRSSSDADAGTEVKEIDLASIPPSEVTGYRVRIPGVGVSFRTEVSEGAAFRLFYTVARGLFHNRWGGNLGPAYTDWSRPVDHPSVYTGEQTNCLAMFPPTTPKVGERPLVGGHHDAGDFDQRPSHTVVAQLLMRAYELNREAFTDGQLDIPESGNGIPDLLDEALWSVRTWEQLQEADGGVRPGVESSRHPAGIYLAHEDPLPYWTFHREPNATARAAGLFAQAARLVAPFDADRSSELAARAVRAWDYAKANGARACFMLYASGELYLLKGTEPYKSNFELNWPAFSQLATEHLRLNEYVTGDRPMPDYVLGYLKTPGASSAIVQQGLSSLTNYANGSVSVFDNDHAHRNGRPSRYPMTWGSGTATHRYADAIVARMHLPGLPVMDRQRYFDALSLAADYLLGCNPNGYVYLTGLGARRAEEPLHLDSLVYIKQGRPPVPGIPVFGPSPGKSNYAWEQPVYGKFYPDFNAHPPGRRYADVRLIIQCSEFTCWESQAPHAQLFALLLGQ